MIILLKSFVKNFNHRVFDAGLILVTNFEKKWRNIRQIMIYLTNIFRSWDNDHYRSSNYTFKLSLHQPIVLIFAFKLAVLQQLTHISIQLLASLLDCFLPYIFSHPSHISFFYVQIYHFGCSSNVYFLAAKRSLFL